MFFNADYTLIIGAALGALVLILIIWVIRLEIKLRRMLHGSGSMNLEDSIRAITQELAEHADFRKDLEAYLGAVEKRLKRSIQATETIRFNPFKGDGSGGNQSFATTFVDERGNGVVLSSLYSRDRVSVFAKPVKGHASEYELSDEEKESLARAETTISER